MKIIINQNKIGQTENGTLTLKSNRNQNNPIGNIQSTVLV